MKFDVILRTGQITLLLVISFLSTLTHAFTRYDLNVPLDTANLNDYSNGIFYTQKEFKSPSSGGGGISLGDNLAVGLVANLKDNQKPLTSGKDAFQLKFHCSGTSNEKCEWARLGFLSTFDRIAKSLVIYTPIVVNATFKSFCNGEPKCKNSQYVGYSSIGSTGSLFRAKRVNSSDPEPLAYPSALVKQMQFLKKDGIEFGEVDIAVFMNSDKDFWFKVNNYIKHG